MPKALELVGRIFGHLTVIKKMPNMKGNTMWMCECSCGNISVLRGALLNFGHYRSCGCGHGFSPRDYIRNNVKIDPITGCWIWKNGFRRGYGQAKMNNEAWSAHRLSYALFKSPIPKNKIVCHNCPGGDNKLCCNPNHLWLGTPALNSFDMIKKHRSLKGSKNPGAVITEEDVQKIKKSLMDGATIASVAAKFEISESIVSRIKHGKTWRHVTIA